MNDLIYIYERFNHYTANLLHTSRMFKANRFCWKSYSNTDTAINNPEENPDTTKGKAENIFICKLPIEVQNNWKEWKRYLQDSLVLDDASLDSIPAGIYKVFIQFEFDEIGKISNVSVLKDPGYRLGLRALDVISKYNSNWKFSEVFEGRPYKSYRRQPIIFVVEEENKEYVEQLPSSSILSPELNE